MVRGPLARLLRNHSQDRTRRATSLKISQTGFFTDDYLNLLVSRCVRIIFLIHVLKREIVLLTDYTFSFFFP